MKHKPKIFDTHDYREFLKNQLEYWKSINPQYSFRAFAEKMGINSLTLLRIMDGKRNFTARTLPLFVKHLKLNQREIEYFELLVLFNQTQDTKTKLILREQSQSPGAHLHLIEEEKSQKYAGQRYGQQKQRS